MVDHRERLTHSVCAPFSLEFNYCLKLPWEVGTQSLSLPLNHATELFITYRLRIALARITSEPGCKEWLCFLLALHFPQLCADKDNTLAQGFSKCATAPAISGNMLGASSWASSDFVNKNYWGGKGAGVKENFILTCSPGNLGAQ